jgi:hypothetical protein
MYLCILRDNQEHIRETFVLDNSSQIGELIKQFHSGHWQIKEINAHEKFNDNARKRT